MHDKSKADCLRYPKSILHEFYQRHLGSPVFTTVTKSLPPDEPHFICHLTCPSVVGDGGQVFHEQMFVGEGRNKRAAEHAAASEALACIEQKGMLPPRAPPVSQALGPPTAMVTPEEVRMLQQKLAGLGNQLSMRPPLDIPSTMGMSSVMLSSGFPSAGPSRASSSSGHSFGAVSFADTAYGQDSMYGASFGNMSREALAAHLQQSLQEIAQLRQRLAAERELRHRAIALLSSAN